jgi:hypothetical protein
MNVSIVLLLAELSTPPDRYHSSSTSDLCLLNLQVQAINARWQMTVPPKLVDSKEQEGDKNTVKIKHTVFVNNVCGQVPQRKFLQTLSSDQ